MDLEKNFVSSPIIYKILLKICRTTYKTREVVRALLIRTHNGYYRTISAIFMLANMTTLVQAQLSQYAYHL